MILLNMNKSADDPNANHTRALSRQVKSTTGDGGGRARGKDLINSYVKYGHAAGPPSINLPRGSSGNLTNNVSAIKEDKLNERRNQSHYDVRPLLLTTEAGTEQV